MPCVATIVVPLLCSHSRRSDAGEPRPRESGHSHLLQQREGAGRHGCVHGDLHSAVKWSRRGHLPDLVNVVISFPVSVPSTMVWYEDIRPSLIPRPPLAAYFAAVRGGLGRRIHQTDNGVTTLSPAISPMTTLQLIHSCLTHNMARAVTTLSSLIPSLILTLHLVPGRPLTRQFNKFTKPDTRQYPDTYRMGNGCPGPTPGSYTLGWEH